MNWEQYKPGVFYKKGKWIYNWFSNMALSDITIDGITYKSVENYYQAMKTEDKDEQMKIAKLSPSNSKAMGRLVTLRPNWEQVKESVMRTALEAKFVQPYWRDMLLATEDDMIIEWNNWGDREWGVDVRDFKGKNKLGKLLMDIREKFKQYS